MWRFFFFYALQLRHEETGDYSADKSDGAEAFGQATRGNLVDGFECYDSGD